MSHSKPLKLTLLLIIFLLIADVALVIIFPNKPPRVLNMEYSTSPIDPQVQITFSEPIDHASVLDGGLITTPFIDGDLSWSGNTLVFTPKENLEFSKSYQIQINTTIKSLSGEYLKEAMEETITTDDLTLLYLSGGEADDERRLFNYNLLTKESVALSPEGFEVEAYDYDRAESKFAVLARETDDQINSVYLLDPAENSFKKIRGISDQDYQLHFAKWLPYENAILVSRSRIDHLNDDGSVETLSDQPEDTELLIYDFDDGKSRQLRTGTTLLFEFFPTPDGLNVAFINEVGVLVVKSIASGTESVIVSQFIDYFGFSEYGSYVIYTTTEDFSIFTIKNEIVLQSGDGEKKIVSLEEIDSVVGAPAVSPDEESVAFTYRLGFGNSQLVVADLKSETREFLTDGEYSIDEPKFAPNGEFISFVEEKSPAEIMIRLYDLVEKNFIETGVTGSQVEWLY